MKRVIQETDIAQLAWDKMQNTLPAVVQDAVTGAVLMLGYANQEALAKTFQTKKVTFFSRSKNRLWTKGETSGIHLELVQVFSDCDQDAVLILANPTGPICHVGTATCFGEEAESDWQFLLGLQQTIKERDELRPENSYTTTLLNAGISRIAQKIGEEGVEVALAAVDKDAGELSEEVADLLFHVMVLLRVKRLGLSDVVKVLRTREGGRR